MRFKYKQPYYKPCFHIVPYELGLYSPSMFDKLKIRYNASLGIRIVHVPFIHQTLIYKGEFLIAPLGELHVLRALSDYHRARK